jgi:uncharacterized protein YodC (DUF2158 family)
MYEVVAGDGEVVSLAMQIFAQDVASAETFSNAKSLRAKAKYAMEAAEVFFGVLNEAAEVIPADLPPPAPPSSLSIPPHPFKTGDRIRLKDAKEVVMTFHECLIRNDMVVARVYDGARTFWYPLEDIEHVPAVHEEPKFRVGDVVKSKDITDGPKMTILGFSGPEQAQVSWFEMNQKYDLVLDVKSLKRV